MEKKFFMKKNNSFQQKKKYYKLIYIKIFLNIFFFILTKDKNNINLLNDKFINPFIYKNFMNNINILKKKNVDLIFNDKKSKIENIMKLIGILPFLQNNLIIFKKRNKIIYELFKSFINNRQINNNIIKIDKNCFDYLKKNFNNIINFKWELIPKLDIINNVRHIIHNYYNEFCLDIFDKSLNLNLNYYINKNKYKLSFNEILELMSKFLFSLFLYRK